MVSGKKYIWVLLCIYMLKELSPFQLILSSLSVRQSVSFLELYVRYWPMFLFFFNDSCKIQVTVVPKVLDCHMPYIETPGMRQKQYRRWSHQRLRPNPLKCAWGTSIPTPASVMLRHFLSVPIWQAPNLRALVNSVRAASLQSVAETLNLRSLFRTLLQCFSGLYYLQDLFYIFLTLLAPSSKHAAIQNYLETLVVWSHSCIKSCVLPLSARGRQYYTSASLSISIIYSCVYLLPYVLLWFFIYE